VDEKQATDHWSREFDTPGYYQPGIYTRMEVQAVE